MSIASGLLLVNLGYLRRLIRPGLRKKGCDEDLRGILNCRGALAVRTARRNRLRPGVSSADCSKSVGVEVLRRSHADVRDSGSVSVALHQLSELAQDSAQILVTPEIQASSPDVAALTWLVVASTATATAYMTGFGYRIGVLRS